MELLTQRDVSILLSEVKLRGGVPSASGRQHGVSDMTSVVDLTSTSADQSSEEQGDVGSGPGSTTDAALESGRSRNSRCLPTEPPAQPQFRHRDGAIDGGHITMVSPWRGSRFVPERSSTSRYLVRDGNLLLTVPWEMTIA